MSESDVVQLGFEVQANYPDHALPDIRSHGDRLAYLGAHPDVVTFELAIMLSHRAAEAAYNAGYEYGAADIVEEIRTFIWQIGPLHTEAVGRDLLYYWPAVATQGA